MKLKALSTAMILATVPMTGAFAAAMDRSGQSMAAFLQQVIAFEAGISVLDAYLYLVKLKMVIRHHHQFPHQ